MASQHCATVQADGFNHPRIQLVSRPFQVQPVDMATFEQAGIQAPAQFTQMVAKRRSEYLAGRCCARMALQQLGLRPVPDVPVQADRSPRWPEGICGSISHSTERAAAVVALRQHVSHLGLDLENSLSAEVSAAIKTQVLTAQDARYCPAASPERFLTLLFSAKEALFKALYPDVQTIFGFEAAAVTAMHSDYLILALQTDLTSHWRSGREVVVHYRWQGHQVVTLVAISA